MIGPVDRDGYARVTDRWYCHQHEDVHAGKPDDFRMEHLRDMDPLYVWVNPDRAAAREAAKRDVERQAKRKAKA